MHSRNLITLFIHNLNPRVARIPIGLLLLGAFSGCTVPTEQSDPPTEASPAQAEKVAPDRTAESIQPTQRVGETVKQSTPLVPKASDDQKAAGLYSLETDYTINKVRTAQKEGHSYIVASSYYGTILGLGYDGTKLWENKLSGFMSHDLWCEDVTGDGQDEIFVASADGTLYCLDSEGNTCWTYKANEAPMNSVCVVRDAEQKPFIVCGGFDSSIYYLSPNGELIKKIHSTKYSIAKPWGKDPSKPPPEKKTHTANFLRPLKLKDGSQALVVQGVIYANNPAGNTYIFKPLEETPFTIIDKGGPVGDLRTVDIDSDGAEEIFWGSSSMIQDAHFTCINVESGDKEIFDPATLRREIDGFGYRVLQPEILSSGEDLRYILFFGSRIILLPKDMSLDETEVLTCKYSFNDMWKDPSNGLFVLASAQSGGSAIHILNTDNPNWKSDYENLAPPGKIAQILESSKTMRTQLADFSRPTWEREPKEVIFMTESQDAVQQYASDIVANYKSPIFLNGKHQSQAENFDRSIIKNEKYRNKRDRRKKYTLTQQQVLDRLTPLYEGAPGIAYWGGHGNDPYMYSVDTTKKVIAAGKGKKTVLIYPELEDHSDDFNYCMNDLIVPLAKYSQGKNANLFMRTKHVFWTGSIYRDVWNPFLSGQYADVFVSAMEETTDKSMEISIAGRLGIWASGAINQWGTRCARDNTSFNRMREVSHQMLPNHFLRTMVYHISSGAQYINNFAVDQEYMSLLWELIAKGALYVPDRNQIVSFSPVHLSMKEPDHHYLNDGSNVKWTTFFDAEKGNDDNYVFSRLNGTWPGAPVTEWDFSRYAAGVKERRLNFLPPYENGLVMITPPQRGVFAKRNQPRGEMRHKLHPMYRNILKEYVTDGHQYFSSDGSKKYSADEYYKTIEADIKASAKKLPITVSGNVAWVAAQTAKNHLRLTLIDSGYINPEARTATVTFNRINPVNITDIVSGESFDTSNKTQTTIDVACGMFRFIDIEYVPKR